MQLSFNVNIPVALRHLSSKAGGKQSPLDYKLNLFVNINKFGDIK